MNDQSQTFEPPRRSAGPVPTRQIRARHIALLLHDLRGGGAERITLRLADEFVREGRQVDLVLVQKKGEYLSDIPPGVRVVDLAKRHVLGSVPAIARYLSRQKPDVLLSALVHVNIAAVLANLVSGRRTRVFLSEHNQITKKLASAGSLRWRMTLAAVPFVYPLSERIIAVSAGVAEDLAGYARLAPEKVRVIFNPVIHDGITQSARQEVDHPWLKPGGPPVILGVGRLHEQKAFDVLIQAFAVVRKQTPCRLLILGEGPERAALAALVAKHGLEADVELAGFVDNPYGYMARAALFVLSSRWEGLPTVLIEAMFCGTAVVATDCPSGPAEILANGRYGPLVPVGDREALAREMLAVLKHGQPSLVHRAEAFTAPESARRYLELFQ